MSENAIERRLHFDVSGMQQRAHRGVRRAAAFLGLSERFMESELPRSLTLGKAIKRAFLPDPIPDDMVPDLKEAWRAWIIGNALRELDQFLSLFLDEAFDMTEMAKIVAGEYPAHHRWQRIDRDTNVANKHRRIMAAANRYISPHDEDNDCLVSLSHARNCLSHDLGQVTAKRVTDGELKVKWLALRTVVKQGDKEVVFDELEAPYQLDPDGPDGHVYVDVIIAERAFTLDDHIRFTPDDLLGICLFYNIVIDRVSNAIAEYAKECGVPFSKSEPSET